MRFLLEILNEKQIHNLIEIVDGIKNNSIETITLIDSNTELSNLKKLNIEQKQWMNKIFITKKAHKLLLGIYTNSIISNWIKKQDYLKGFISKFYTPIKTQYIYVYKKENKSLDIRKFTMGPLVFFYTTIKNKHHIYIIEILWKKELNLNQKIIQYRTEYNRKKYRDNFIKDLSIVLLIAIIIGAIALLIVKIIN